LARAYGFITGSIIFLTKHLRYRESKSFEAGEKGLAASYHAISLIGFVGFGQQTVDIRGHFLLSSGHFGSEF
jgi:hypothetical protein